MWYVSVSVKDEKNHDGSLNLDNTQHSNESWPHIYQSWIGKFPPSRKGKTRIPRFGGLPVCDVLYRLISPHFPSEIGGGDVLEREMYVLFSMIRLELYCVVSLIANMDCRSKFPVGRQYYNRRPL